MNCYVLENNVLKMEKKQHTRSINMRKINKILLSKVERSPHEKN
jgi:hypothetical protein